MNALIVALVTFCFVRSIVLGYTERKTELNVKLAYHLACPDPEYLRHLLRNDAPLLLLGETWGERILGELMWIDGTT